MASSHFSLKSLEDAQLDQNKFTEVLYISKDDFNAISEINPESVQIIEMIKTKICKRKNLSAIGMTWYIWNKLGHISVDCKQFKNIRGNILK